MKMNKKYLRSVLIHLAVFSIVVLPVFVFALDTGTPTPNKTIKIGITNPFKYGNDIYSVIVQLLNYVVMPIAGVLVFVYIIKAGFDFITAQGNPKAIEDAKSNLLWALIGAGVLLGAAGISKVVQNTIENLVK